MQISGIIYDETRAKKQERYQAAVKRAGFLENEERENWKLLGYLLSTDELTEAERTLIDEDLRRLLTKEKLEQIKPKR